jgi:hypothetical protein
MGRDPLPGLAIEPKTNSYYPGCVGASFLPNNLDTWHTIGPKTNSYYPGCLEPLEQDGAISAFFP